MISLFPLFMDGILPATETLVFTEGIDVEIVDDGITVEASIEVVEINIVET